MFFKRIAATVAFVMATLLAAQTSALAAHQSQHTTRSEIASIDPGACSFCSTLSAPADPCVFFPPLSSQGDARPADRLAPALAPAMVRILPRLARAPPSWLS